MKKLIIVVGLLFLPFINLKAQINYDQKASELMNGQNWFELKDFFDEHRDNLGDFMQLCSSSFVNTYFNKPYAAIKDWNEFLDKYAANFDLQQKLGFSILLMNLHEQVQDYGNAIQLCNELLQIENLEPSISDFISHRKKTYTEFAQFPAISFK